MATPRRARLSAARVLPIVGVLALARVAGAGPFPVDGIPAEQARDWAIEVVEFVRGPQDTSVPQSPPASFGSAGDALGFAEGSATSVVSLGEAGSLTVRFGGIAANGPGPDLAVYENAFATVGGIFSELGFVEVSSDGVNFARFETTSLTPEPVGAFGPLDPTDTDGFAGRLPAGLGVPFDLSDLAAAPEVVAGLVDLDAIRFVRVVDVIGNGFVLDAQGQVIHDPWPTPFAESGIDVDGVASLHPLQPVPLGARVRIALALACAALLLRLGARRGFAPGKRSC